MFYNVILYISDKCSVLDVFIDQSLANHVTIRLDHQPIINLYADCSNEIATPLKTVSNLKGDFGMKK